MDFEWDSLWLFIAIFVGILPFLVVRLRKAWKWYQRMQSGSSETLEEHVARIEKGEEKK